MTLPSQTARTSYRRSHTFRARQALNARLIVAGVALAAVVIVVWVLIARSGGGPNSPPAVATNEESAKETNGSGDANQLAGSSASTQRETQRRPEQQSRVADDEPRVVMGEDVIHPPAIESEPQSREAEPERTAAAPHQQPPASTSRGTESKPQERTTKAADQPQSQPPRPVTHAQRLLDEGARQANAGRLVEARKTLSMALEQLDPYDRDAETARDMLGEINEILVFSAKVAPGDPYASSYRIQPGDALSKVARSLGVDWRFIARINNIQDPSKIQAGQSIKIIDGRFHVVVRKAAYALDLYLGDGSDRIFVRSFNVGLGELDSTPVGRFAVSSRVPNPDWKNPRTGEYFDQNDPENPIGEHWIGMKGIEAKTEGMLGFGLHGTIEPESIGEQASMGCVRMRPEDIELIYELLTSDLNTIEIVS